jgi:serine/threonine-protein kinase RsbW
VPVETMNAVQATMTNDLQSIARARELIVDIARAHNVSADVVSHMSIALDEALSNIVKYGYADDRVHEIRLSLAVSEGMLVAQIEDDGVPFDPLSAPQPKLDVPFEQRGPGGLGVHFIRTLMNDVSYARVAGHNRLILKKRLDNTRKEH